MMYIPTLKQIKESTNVDAVMANDQQTYAAQTATYNTAARDDAGPGAGSAPVGASTTQHAVQDICGLRCVPPSVTVWGSQAPVLVAAPGGAVPAPAPAATEQLDTANGFDWERLLIAVGIGALVVVVARKVL